MKSNHAPTMPNHAPTARHGRDAVHATPALRGSGGGMDKEHPARSTMPHARRGQKQREALAREAREALEADGQLVLSLPPPELSLEEMQAGVFN